MGQRYCRHCGDEVQPDDRFCPACGERLDGTREENGWEGGEQNRGYETTASWGTRRGESEYQTERYPQGYSHSNDSARAIAAITHVLALFTWVVGPLVVYIVTDDPFVQRNAANAMNWQIVFAVYLAVSTVLVVVLVGFVLVVLLPILDFALIVLAALKASEGEAWQYPLTPRLF
jgi:uncharacterized Tic20 family protein